MDSEFAKQKETIHFLDGLLGKKVSETSKQKQVIIKQGRAIEEMNRAKKKLENIVKLQGRLLDENRNKKEFDEELHLYELFKLGTVKAYGALASKTAVSYNYNTKKNRPKIDKFLEKLRNKRVIQTVSNGTIALVDYDEAQRLIFGKE